MNMANRYSTSFARWWCESGRHTPLGRLITAVGGQRSETEPPGIGPQVPEAYVLHTPTVSMTARRAAIDAVLSKTEGEQAGDSPASS
jgi:hypothetical protein